MNKFKRIFIGLLCISVSVFMSVSCAKVTSAISSSVDTALGGVGCSSFQSKVFDSMYEYLDNENAMPSEAEIQEALSLKIDELAKARGLTDKNKIKIFKNKFNEVYHLMISEVRKKKSTKTAREHLQALIELEMRDQSSVSSKTLNSLMDQKFGELEAISRQLDMSCETGAGPEYPDFPEAGEPGAKVVKGMDNVIATAYQSCRVLELPPMNAATPDVKGITIRGTHSDGVGSKRFISSVREVQLTHPYVKLASSGNSTCFDVYNNPLIYDYGGEPKVNSSKNSIDFFTDAGTGTQVLGVDCSALVSAAIGVGGLRFKPELENKAIFVRQNSSKFINAKLSNFTCFENVTVTPNASIRPGDIAAVVGHVLMIDAVGSDPFGINSIKNLSDCDKVHYSRFNFTVAQSSPSKGGVGINKYHAHSYLAESDKVATLFHAFAKAACQAKISKKNITPSSSSWGIIRHKGTKECVSPKVTLMGQTCVNSCIKQ